MFLREQVSLVKDVGSRKPGGGERSPGTLKRRQWDQVLSDITNMVTSLEPAAVREIWRVLVSTAKSRFAHERP